MGGVSTTFLSRGLPRPRFSPEESRQIKVRAFADLPQNMQIVLQNVPREYIWQELDFLMGRFLHDEARKYLTTDRTGRGRALNVDQREAVLTLYVVVHQRLYERGLVEPAEFVRMAHRLLFKGGAGAM